jgi:hypothetical protein
MPNSTKLSDNILSVVGEFKAITTRGEKRPLLSEKEHKKLVIEKHEIATKMEYHVTLFRVQDKKHLPKKEVKDHTVPGPYWTPPSSVGFVLGASAQDHRIYLATETTLSKSGLLGNNGLPSIYARELMSAISVGYSARKPKASEKYGKSGKGPDTVLTPPSSPILFAENDIQSIMDVNKGWNALPMKACELSRLTTPMEERFRERVKDSGFEMDDLEDGLIEISLNKKIFPLIDEGILDLSKMMDLSEEDLSSMLNNQEIILVLSRQDLTFGELIELYSKYIEDNSEQLEAEDILDLYEVSMRYQKSLDNLVNKLGVTLEEIARIYREYAQEISLFANNNIIEFLQEYHLDIGYERLLEISIANADLFCAMVSDPENIINDIGIEEFIGRFENIQEELREAEMEGCFTYEDSPYDRIVNEVFHDGTPDGCLHEDNMDPEEFEEQYEHDTDASDYMDSDDESVSSNDDLESECSAELEKYASDYDYMDSDDESVDSNDDLESECSADGGKYASDYSSEGESLMGDLYNF